MSNIDRDELAKEVTLRHWGVLRDDIPAGRIADAGRATADFIAAAVDAARAEGYEQGKAEVRDAVDRVAVGHSSRCAVLSGRECTCWVARINAALAEVTP